MSNEGFFKGYVKTRDGSYFVQLPSPDAKHGFFLLSDDQSWDGGIGVATEWTAVAKEDVPAAARDSLDWLLEEDEDHA